MIAVVLALAVFAGVGIAWSVRLDNADRANEWHLLHGPQSGCVDCLDK